MQQARHGEEASNAAMESRLSEFEQRQMYVESVVNPILAAMVEACLSGQPSDTRDFMIRWLMARSAGAPMPVANAGAMQVPQDVYVQSSIRPLLGPMASEIISAMSPDPIPMMIQHLSRGLRGAVSLPETLQELPRPPRLAGALM